MTEKLRHEREAAGQPMPKSEDEMIGSAPVDHLVDANKMVQAVDATVKDALSAPTKPKPARPKRKRPSIAAQLRSLNRLG
jgi:hypothetical protein